MTTDDIEKEALDGARTLLLALLGTEPTPRDDIVNAAIEEGIALKLLEREAAETGISLDTFMREQKEDGSIVLKLLMRAGKGLGIKKCKSRLDDGLLDDDGEMSCCELWVLQSKEPETP